MDFIPGEKDAANVFNNGFFNVSNLQKYVMDNIETEFPPESYLFGEEDFYVKPKSAEMRCMVAAKLGNLFIKFEPGGKGSFLLKIYNLDHATLSIRSLFEYTIGRYPAIEFSQLVPLYSTAGQEDYGPLTFMPRPKGNEAQEARLTNASSKIKELLIRMAHRQSIEAQDLYAAFGNFFAVAHEISQDRIRAQQLRTHAQQNNIPSNIQQTTIATPKPKRSSGQEYDVIDFGKNFELKPINEAELAAKIAARYYVSDGLSEEEAAELLQEFFTTAQLSPSSAKENFIDKLSEILVDKKRYPLAMILGEENQNNLKNAFDLLQKGKQKEINLAKPEKKLDIPEEGLNQAKTLVDDIRNQTNIKLFHSGNASFNSLLRIVRQQLFLLEGVTHQNQHLTNKNLLEQIHNYAQLLNALSSELSNKTIDKAKVKTLLDHLTKFNIETLCKELNSLKEANFIRFTHTLNISLLNEYCSGKKVLHFFIGKIIETIKENAGKNQPHFFNQMLFTAMLDAITTMQSTVFSSNPAKISELNTALTESCKNIKVSLGDFLLNNIKNSIKEYSHNSSSSFKSSILNKTSLEVLKDKATGCKQIDDLFNILCDFFTKTQPAVSDKDINAILTCIHV